MREARRGLPDRLLGRPATNRGTYALNTLAGIVNALVMAVLQLMTTRVLGAEAAGRVSVDAATVLLCFHIGQLNMRPVQATDLRGRYTFSEYFTLKAITVSLMGMTCLVYTCLRGYDGSRRLFCLGFCAYKAVEALSDCFWATLQSRGRLDLAGLGGALYHFCCMVTFAVVLLLTRRLDAAAAAMAAVGGANLLLYTWPLGRRLETPRLSAHWKRMGQLVSVLVPLFAAGYFLNVAITLPKYALERTVSEAVQGCFAALYMTAQGVLLLCAFLYFPQLTALAQCFKAGDKAGFRRILRRLGAVIVLLDGVILLGGWLLGPELLGWFFDLELTAYRTDLLLILLGGGCFALYTMMSYGLIAMNAQRRLALLTLLVLGASALVNGALTPRLGLRGAALGYLVTVALAALLILCKLLRALGNWPGEAGRPFLDLLRFVRLRDVIQVWKLPVAALAAPFCRRRRPDLWIVCEDPMEARDNGYWFFRYVRENHPEQPCVYAIAEGSPDAAKVAALGETVEYGSLKHWVLYLAARVQISSQKSGDPNAPIFYFLQVYGLLKNRRLFLQHGVTVNDPTWLHYGETGISRFLCGAQPEFEFVRDRFGYPEGHVRYTGFCRFDGLHRFATDPKLILIMPSWRNWLVIRKDKLRALEGTGDLSQADYFVRWRAFLMGDGLRELAEQYHVHFLFYPHRNTQRYIDMFPTDLPHVEICRREDYDVQDLLKRAALLVTDYSSVFFDMVYMQKPVVFYPFDYETFRKGQYQAGWFDYEHNPFGGSSREQAGVYALIRQAIEGGFATSPAYVEAHRACFPLCDEDNARRAYEVARALNDEGRGGTHGR